jgi:hypothetical protein
MTPATMGEASTGSVPSPPSEVMYTFLDGIRRLNARNQSIQLVDFHAIHPWAPSFPLGLMQSILPRYCPRLHRARNLSSVQSELAAAPFPTPPPSR